MSRCATPTSSTQDFGEGIADGAWTRWVLAFVADPGARSSRTSPARFSPGGVALFHEYIDYQAWRLVPPTPTSTATASWSIKSWRDSGGEPDAALDLPRQLAAAGLELVAIRPMVEIITADDPMWQWPASFVATNASRLARAWLLHRRGSRALRDYARHGRAWHADDDPGGRRNDRDQALASRSIAAAATPSISTIS